MGSGDELVLVVDDDEDLREMVRAALERAGYEVSTAANGLDALSEVARRTPAVILLDMRMPVQDGWEFARTFRARHDRSAPILVMTAATDARRRAAEIDAEGWLAKPFTIAELLAAVKKLRCAQA
jgi:DNA-binding response OmpR family regulator